MRLTCTDDQQIIADAAQKLIEAHLRWGNSNESEPSKGQENVRGEIYSAIIKRTGEADGWAGLDTGLAWQMAERLFEQAAQLADRKWAAAMTLLGIEQ